MFVVSVGRYFVGVHTTDDGKLVENTLPTLDENAEELKKFRANQTKLFPSAADKEAARIAVGLMDEETMMDSWRESLSFPLVTENNVLLMLRRDVQPGQDMSYGELAKKVGTSARAVGTAMRLNKTPLFIPCHRIVGAKGQMTGYSGAGGIDTKKKLLLMEKKAAAASSNESAIKKRKL